MEHTSSNGGMLTPNGQMMSPFLPFHAPGMYHMAVPASHAELMRYHHMPAAPGHFGFMSPASMVNGHMYAGQQPVMYPIQFPGALLVLHKQKGSEACICGSLGNSMAQHSSYIGYVCKTQPSMKCHTLCHY